MYSCNAFIHAVAAFHLVLKLLRHLSYLQMFVVASVEFLQKDHHIDRLVLCSVHLQDSDTLRMTIVPCEVCSRDSLSLISQRWKVIHFMMSLGIGVGNASAASQLMLEPGSAKTQCYSMLRVHYEVLEM
jgi:hypothetical protein